jgi:hypothetical protein
LDTPKVAVLQDSKRRGPPTPAPQGHLLPPSIFFVFALVQPQIASMAMTPAAPANSVSAPIVTSGAAAVSDVDLGAAIEVDWTSEAAAPRRLVAVVVDRVLSISSCVLTITPDVPTTSVAGNDVVMIKLPLVKVETTLRVTVFSGTPGSITGGIDVGTTGPGCKGTTGAIIPTVSLTLQMLWICYRRRKALR